MTVTLALGTAKGAFLFHGDAERREWRVEGPIFKGWRVSAFGRGPSGEYLAATASPVYGTAVHLSRDLSAWRQASCSPSYSSDSGWKLEEVWKFAATGDRLFAGVSEAGLFESRDGGDRWELVESLSNLPSRGSWYPGFGGLCAHSIAIDRADPQRMWVGISAVGAYRSEDGARTWEPANGGVPAMIEDESHDDIGHCVHALCQDTTDADTLYRQDHAGMFKSEDAGATWDRREDGLPSGFGFPLVLDERTGAVFAVPLESDEYRLPVDGRLRVYRSTDGMGSWHASGTGLPESQNHAGVLRQAMAADGGDPTGVYFGTTAGEVYASPDGGETWARLPGTYPRILALEAFEG